MFAVRAVDNQGIFDPTPATFSWTVLTPAQGIQNLISTIDSMHLSKFTKIGLEAPLKIAMNLLNHHQTLATCYTMDGFLQIVNAYELAGQLTHQQASDLRQQAIAIQQSLGCHSTPVFSSSPSSSPYDTYNDFIGPLVSAP